MNLPMIPPIAAALGWLLALVFYSRAKWVERLNAHNVQCFEDYRASIETLGARLLTNTIPSTGATVAGFEGIADGGFAEVTITFDDAEKSGKTLVMVVPRERAAMLAKGGNGALSLTVVLTRGDAKAP